MKKFGFTLSEILTCLSIIGIVSALVIPNLSKDYQRKIFTSKLQNAKADFELAMGNMLLKDGVEDLYSTDAWRNLSNTSLSTNSTQADITAFVSQISQQMPINESEGARNIYKNMKNENYDLQQGFNVLPVSFFLKNGVEYKIRIVNPNAESPVTQVRNSDYLIENGINYAKRAAFIYIDVNGDDAPNIIGRDLFYYELSTDGHLYPYGGEEWRLYNGVGNGENNITSLCKENLEGLYCAEYLERNGYKMDY